MSIVPLFGPYGKAAVEVIDQLAQYGANALWFHGFDAAAFDACAKYQIAACVEFKTFRTDFNTRPELIPIGVDGQPIRYGRLVQGVCLSKTAFLEETEENLITGLQTFQPIGIWLDYLSYAGWFETPEPDLQESCFCPDCIEEFCEASGLDATTPDQILNTAAEQWTQHKCERIAAFANRYASLIRSYLPECTIGAYMCPWAAEEFDGALSRIFAQDYELLASAIDVFTPLIYVQKSGRSAKWGCDFLEQTANQLIPKNHKVQLILDALDFPDSLKATAESSRPSWGIQLFGGAQVFRVPEQARIFQQAVEQIARKLF